MNELSDPIGLINNLQKQNKALEYEVANLRRDLMLAQKLGGDLEQILRYMRLRQIIPLYLGKQERHDVLCKDLDGDILDWDSAKSISQVILEQIWLLEDAPLPSEAKDALRNASKMGCERW